MRYKFADSLGNSIMAKLKSGADTFEHQAQIYSMGGESRNARRYRMGGTRCVDTGNLESTFKKEKRTGIPRVEQERIAYHQKNRRAETGHRICVDDESIFVMCECSDVHICKYSIINTQCSM